MKWKEQLNGDCPKRDAHQIHERCDLTAIMHDVTRFHTCVERVSGSNPTRWIGVVPLAVQRV
jgi:hypothetical protein